MRKRLQSRNVKFRESIVPRSGDTQFFLYDPDGVGVEPKFPQGVRRPGYSRLVEPSLVAQTHHFLDKDRFLFLIEACEQRLGRIGDVALVHRAIVEKLGFVAHLLDNIVRRVSFCARNS
jgi:hypothetical protein